MGLLDSVVGMLGQGQPGSQAGGGNAALISAVIGLLMNNNAGSASGSGALGGLGGGLAGLVGQLQQGGLGDIVGSWISTGQNQPVSASQLQSALGDDTVSNLSQQTGLPQGDLLGQLTQVLPQLVDHLTPNGQMPSSDALGSPGTGAGGMSEMSDLLGAFLKR